MKRTGFASLGIPIILLILYSATFSATLHVPSEYGTIQAGIDAALYGDTVLVASGTYIESLNFAGKSLVLKSESGAAETIIQTPSGARDRVSFPEDLDTLISPKAYEAYLSAAKLNAGDPVIALTAGSDATTEITGFTIDGNNSVQCVACLGSDPTISECIIQNGYCSGDGGGMWIQNCGPVLSDNIVRNNYASITGAGVFARMGEGYGTVRIVDNTFYGNQGGNGPAISVIQGEGALIEGNIVYGNIVPDPGSYIRGVVYVRGDNVDVVNNTIDGNTRGILGLTMTNVDFRNNIITDGLEGGFEIRDDDGPNSDVTWDYNDVWNNAGNDYMELASAGANDISSDPLFEPTYPGEYYLTVSSPCIDAGDPDPIYNDPDGSRNDMGAVPYEGIGPHTPITLRVPSEYSTIQAAIDAALYGDTVLVASGTYIESLNFAGKSLVLKSESGADETIIQTPSGARDRISLPEDLDTLISPKAYESYLLAAKLNAGDPVITLMAGSDATTEITGFTIDGNNSVQCVVCYGSDPTISECIIQNGNGSGDGGGVWIQNCGPVLSDNIIRNNYTPITGAGVFARMGEGYGTVRIVDNAFYGNQGGNGPAISLIQGEGALIEGNIVYGNIVPDPGSYIRGVVYVRGNNVDVVNNTIDGNTRGILGLTMTNVDFRNNIITDGLEGGFEIRDDDGPNSDVTWDYNDVWNNAGNDYMGLASAGANDISSDPLFEPTYPGEYYLTVSSPCIDAGDPDPIYNDPDGSRNDMGAVPYEEISPHTPVTLRVPSEYSTIQAAIDAALYGDTVLVASGIYEEQIGFYGKSLLLLSESGADETIIRAPFQSVSFEMRFDVDSNSAGFEAVSAGAVISLIPGSGEITTISGFTIDGNGNSRGIYCVGSDPTITGCIVEQCVGDYDGGGLFFEHCAPLVENNVIRSNLTPISGAGIFIRLGEGFGTARFIGNTIYYNYGGNGPAISLIEGEGAIVERNIAFYNTVVSGSYIRGAIYFRGSNIEVVNNTCHNNTRGMLGLTISNVDIRNNIIVQNIEGGLEIRDDDGPNSNVTSDYNDVWDNSGNDYMELALPGSNDISADPLFLGDYLNEYYLSMTSPCVDAGDPDPAYNDPDDSRNDMGAVPYFDAGTHTPGVLNVPSGYSTIQKGIDAAYLDDTVMVASGIYEGNVRFYGKDIVLTSSSGAHNTIITTPHSQTKSLRSEKADSSLAGISGACDMSQTQIIWPLVAFEAGCDEAVMFDITVDGGGFTQCVNCYSASPEIRGCIIQNGQGWKDGGGIFVQNAAPEIVENIIRYNQTPITGAGIFVRMGEGVGTVRIAGNTLYGNQGGNGPAISLIEGEGALVERNLVYNNIVPDAGSYIRGVVYVRGANVDVVNNTIDGNTRGILGLTITNVDFRNNIITNGVEGGLEIRDDDGPNSNATWDYNDVWNNAGNDYMGLAYPWAHDISADPQFNPAEPNKYLLLISSPCIDAGDPDPSYYDPDGTINDIGANYFQHILGDANGDGVIDLGDAVHIINYIFKFGPPPVPLGAGDADCDGQITVGDAVFIVRHVFLGGPAPECP